MLETNHFRSNEWLTPLIEEVDQILSQNPDRTLDITSAVLKDVDSGTTEIPWTVVFPSDKPDQVCHHLLATLQTPDGHTPFFDPSIQTEISQIQSILKKLDVFSAKHAAYYFVRHAAGKPDEAFRTFQDFARRYPAYAESWQSDFTNYFGTHQLQLAKTTHPQLFHLLNQTVTFSNLYFSPKPTTPEPESTIDYIERVGLSLKMFHNIDTTSLQGLQTATKLLNLGKLPYQLQTYNLRQIPFNPSSWQT